MRHRSEMLLGSLVLGAALWMGAVPPTLAGGTIPDASSGGELTVDEYTRNFPPPPADLRIRRQAGDILLTWNAPPAPSGKVGYDPVIDHYIVYSVSSDDEPTALFSTKSRSATIKSRRQSGAAGYAVSAVQRSGIESPLSEVVHFP